MQAYGLEPAIANGEWARRRPGIEYSPGCASFRPVQAVTEVRIDKWLWAVRLYKSRSLATEACQGGHVKIAGQSVKPSRSVRLGDTITALSGGVRRTVKVLALLEQRVGAGVLSEYRDDLTPPEEIERARRERAPALLQFPKGWGRPTKKQRRQVDGFLGSSGS
jgi:ribosome-associated heat shock protein Hsp15